MVGFKYFSFKTTTGQRRYNNYLVSTYENEFEKRTQLVTKLKHVVIEIEENKSRI